MSAVNPTKAATMLEAIKASLSQAARFNPNDAVAPAAILWADEDRQWEPLLPQLRRLVPELFTYGTYDLQTNTGPVIWLRCIIERGLPEVEIPEGTIPVIYLPGISRQVLRAAQDCPDALKPLVELQYRGVCWTQKNGRDWTIEAFLISPEGGLGLDVARDAPTRRALHSALTELATTPVAKLRGKRLEAEDFDKLLSEDTVKDLLNWLNDPAGVRKAWPPAKWKAFQSRCKADYKFDPDKDGELVGAERLAGKQDLWAVVWDRFAESPALYPGIPVLLQRATPTHLDMFADWSPWPSCNEKKEEELRVSLMKAEQLPALTARELVLSLEQEHGERRDWVWSRLGGSPLANALQPLNLLAESTGTLMGGATPDDMAKAYTEGAWRADAAALEALASVKTTADYQAVAAAVRSIYLPWLEAAAEHLQKLLDRQPLARTVAPVTVEAGSVLLFADGLRLDVGQRLVERLRGQRLQVLFGTRWAGLPTVTATAKPTVSPVTKSLRGDTPGSDFLPAIVPDGQALTTDRFRKLLDAAGYQYLASNETGDPSGRAWTEYGELDKLGHALQAKLADRVAEQIELLLERIGQLLAAGWQEIRIVTDHGWLLMPGGLPKVELPKYLTETRWSRCATIKGASKVEVPTVPWSWNPDIRVAVPPGIACFGAGNEYAHGGVSLQECQVPDIRVSSGSGKSKLILSIQELRWIGLRCQVRIEPPATGVTIDLRTKVNDSTTSVVEPKAPGGDGIARLLVENDDLEGTAVYAVVLDGAGQVIGKKPTTIGGAE